MINPVTLEVIRSGVNATVDEMQKVIFRTGYSTIIRESKDASAGITDPAGRLIGQAVQLPLHLGVFTPAIKGLYEYYPQEEINDGDIFLVNHPYIGGSPQASDFTIILPVFDGKKLLAMCCNIAHKPDIGGTVPGSCSGTAKELFHEGLQLPPIKYYDKGKLNRDIENIMKANSRLPDLLIGDLRGQVGCAILGKKRMIELSKKYGIEIIRSAFDEIILRTKLAMQSAFQSCPEDHEARAEGCLDPDESSKEGAKMIRLKTSFHKGVFTFDFSESDGQSKGPINIRPNLIRAACHYALVAFANPDLQCNHALSEISNVLTKLGTIVDPEYPAPVNSYSSTLQLGFQVIANTLTEFFPNQALAGGGHNRAAQISGFTKSKGVDNKYKTKKRWAFYEILGGGQGARRNLDGLSGSSHFMSNVALASIEIIETEFPLMVTKFELIKDSGGPGKTRGGLGFRRTYKMTDNALYVHRTGTYHVNPPWGIDGGLPGGLSIYKIVRSNGREENVSSRAGEYELNPGDSVVVERPGGGGCGDPKKRDPKLVMDDVLNGYVSIEAANSLYGSELSTHEGLQMIAHSG
jgi:N-methylhydantoinase B